MPYKILYSFVLFCLGELPTVGPPTQFFTKSPGLDNSVLVTSIDAANQAILMVVILIVAVVLLGFLYLIYKKVNINNKTYNKEKLIKKEKSSNIDLQPMTESPLPSSLQTTSNWGSGEQSGNFV